MGGVGGSDHVFFFRCRGNQAARGICGVCVCGGGEFEELPKEDFCTGLGEVTSELKG